MPSSVLLRSTQTAILQAFFFPLQKAASQNLTGQLRFLSGERWVGTLLFWQGALIWASNPRTQPQRLQRLVQYYLPICQIRSWPQDHHAVLEEYQWFNQAIAPQDFDSTVLHHAVQKIVLEVCHEIMQVTLKQNLTVVCRLEPIENPSISLNATDFVVLAQNFWERWQTAQLSDYFPHWVPVVSNPDALRKQASSTTYDKLKTYLNGQYCLWDLAAILQQDIVTTTLVLAGYQKQGLIEFRATTVSAQTPSTPLDATQTQRPLVLCVDDNVHICQQLEQQITQLGYRCLTLQNSVQALQTILETRPSLIILDLVMDVVSGYELCSQIRRMSLFRKTPIVILTSNDGMIDRVRTKVVGATEFLGKPIRPAQISLLLQHYIPNPAKASIMFYPD